MGKRRGLFEGPEWDEFAWNVEPDAVRFDEQFLGISNSIHLDALANSEGLVEDDDEYRVLVTDEYPDAPELWVYFRIEDDDNVELLWVVKRGGWLPPQIH